MSFFITIPIANVWSTWTVSLLQEAPFWPPGKSELGKRSRGQNLVWGITSPAAAVWGPVQFIGEIQMVCGGAKFEREGYEVTNADFHAWEVFYGTF